MHVGVGVVVIPNEVAVKSFQIVIDFNIVLKIWTQLIFPTGERNHDVLLVYLILTIGLM